VRNPAREAAENIAAGVWQEAEGLRRLAINYRTQAAEILTTADEVEIDAEAKVALYGYLRDLLDSDPK
jgi:purine-nucleoside phosphorylase